MFAYITNVWPKQMYSLENIFFIDYNKYFQVSKSFFYYQTKWNKRIEHLTKTTKCFL